MAELWAAQNYGQPQPEVQTMSDRRDTFLIEMYKQMMNDINRHILVVSQSIATLVTAFAVFTLVDTQVITLDLATSILILLCAWLCLHLLDASYRYNRNPAIIANIECRFLAESDLKEIHYYFVSHRPNSGMIKHLKIQQMLGVGLGLLNESSAVSEALPTERR
jgi:hypothetical protein